MRNFLASLWEFALKLISHVYVVVVAVIGGILGIVSGVGSDFQTPGASPLVPLWVWLPLFGIGYGVAVIWTFHDVRMERDAVQKRATTAETELENKRTELADQQARHQRALEAQREGYEKRLAEAAVLAAINPSEWIATCDESGEFPIKALVFNLRHRFENMGARQAFGLLRCIVTDPDGIRTEATGMARFYQYVDPIFPGAPPVRPGLYRFSWQGQKSNGEWIDITSGEHEIQPPPMTGLEVEIDDEKLTTMAGVGFILEIEYHVTNHDRVPHELILKAVRDGSPFYHRAGSECGPCEVPANAGDRSGTPARR